MKNIIFILTILFSLQGFSQKTTLSPEADKLVNEFVKLYNGIEYKEYDKLSQEFGKLMGETSYTPTGNIFEDWIKEHLSETNFKTVEQAVDLESRMTTAYDKFSEKADILIKERIALAEKSANEEDFIEKFSSEFEKRTEIQP